MTLEEGITTAIQFERRVHATYEKAANLAADPTARRIFEVMAREELSHVAYLERCLGKWKEAGSLVDDKLETVIPNKGAIQAGLRRMQGKVTRKQVEAKPELALLRQALLAENETASFYRETVGKLPPEGQRLFARFIEIEEAHGALVQAEIDAIEHAGFWCEMREFELESS
jgi:rubrerythrin